MKSGVAGESLADSRNAVDVADEVLRHGVESAADLSEHRFSRDVEQSAQVPDGRTD